MSKLYNLLKKTSESNTFYKKIIQNLNITRPCEIEEYPILKKEELQRNKRKMFSIGYDSKYYNQELRRQTSSGSTGIPISVYWDYNDWYASNLPLWRKRYQWYEVKPSDRNVVFTLNTYNISTKSSNIVYLINGNTLSINVSNIVDEKQYLEIIKLINEYNPVWIYIQPYILEKLLSAYIRNEIIKPKRLKYIESVGEILPNKLRERAINYFKIPVANMYGSEEMNCIAFECPDHHMHVLADNVFLEVFNNGIKSIGKGEAIITNLNNYAMPLIRYNQGDSIVVKDGIKCKWDSSEQIITRIFGRQQEVVHVGNIELNPYFLVELMGEITNLYNDIILSYRFVYKRANNRLLCYLSVRDPNWFNNIKTEILKLFLDKSNYLDYVNIDITSENEAYKYSKKRRIIEIL